MSKPFQITVLPTEISRLVIHPQAAAGLGLDPGLKSAVGLCFGSICRAVTIILDAAVSQNEIGLPAKLLAEMHLPDYPLYELTLQGGRLIIGPYIGLLLSKEGNRLTASRLKSARSYLHEYAALHGAVVVFALDQVDTANGLIAGYCYDPRSDSFRAGVFPYPAAIYRKAGMSDKWKAHFFSVIGPNVFNSHYIGKWKMYEWLSADTEIAAHIPETVRYRSPGGCLDLLRTYGSLYLKPVSGLRGRGILRATFEGGRYLFQGRETGKNNAVTFDRPEQAADFLRKKLGRGRYLIQRAIPLLEADGSVIDFRCIMQKDQSARWVCQAIIGRCGVAGSVVSNISSGGRAFAIDQLGEILHIGIDTAAVKKRIETLAIKVCSALDSGGAVWGTLGIDIGVDTDGAVWLIEVNNRDPDPTIALDIHDEKLYYTLMTGPMRYAKALAGFPALI